MGVVCTNEGVKVCSILEEGYDVCSRCFDWTALVGDGLVRQDLASTAIFLVIDAEADKVR